MEIPKHIAIIMDGNGRWASARGVPRIFGHREGARNVKRVATLCSNLGVKVLTIYGFSIENWNRPEREVDLLMKLIKVYTHVGAKLCSANNIKFRLIGDRERLSSSLRKAMESLEKLTEKNTGMILQAAVSYGGRDELVRAIRQMARRAKAGEVLPEEISESMVSEFLDTRGVPDPDLVIRTSGEFRTSNYLLWQSAYAEYYFTEVFWPDFDERELHKAIESFGKRERRFGGVDAKPSAEVL